MSGQTGPTLKGALDARLRGLHFLWKVIGSHSFLYWGLWIKIDPPRFIIFSSLLLRTKF